MGERTPTAPNAPKRPVPAVFKLAIGCLVAGFGIAAVAVVALGAGGLWLKGKAGQVIDGVQARTEAQQEATAILDRLRREHAFTQPADGRIDPASADRFFRAIELAWTPIESTLRRLEATAERSRDGRPRLGDVVEGVKASGLLVDTRLHIARALDEASLSLEEFVWTGGALRTAWRDASAPGAHRGSREAGEPVTLANLALAERHRDLLAAMVQSADEVNPSAVFDLATVWLGMVPGLQPDSP